MRQVLLVLIGIFALTIPALAATVGCPVNFPEEGGLLAGIEINEFSDYGFSNKEQFGPASLNSASSQYIAKLQYGINNWVAATVKLGSADLKLSDPNRDTEYNFSKGTTWGAGAKIVLYEKAERAMRLCASSEYLTGHPGDAVNDGEEYSAKWNEWDNALFMVFSSQNVEFDESCTGSSFYLGAKYARTTIDWTGPEDPDDSKKEWHVELRADDDIIFFAGFDVVLDTASIISAEARIGNIDSYTVAFSYRF